MAKLKQKSGKKTFNEFFLSGKNPKRMLQAFASEFNNQLQAIQNHGCKIPLFVDPILSLERQDFRQRFFKEAALYHLGAKQYKRRKNAFYIINYLIQTDAYFAEVALKEFHKIKCFLFQSEDLPNLPTLEMAADYLKFKVFVNSKVLDWVEKYSCKFPDLFIWKKSQSQFFNNMIENDQAKSEKFSDKYQQLKIYRVIFTRNQNEVEKMRSEFLKIKFECHEARKLMNLGICQQEETKYEQEEEKLGKPMALCFPVDMSVFVDDRDNNEEEENILFLNDDESSTQLHNQESMTPIVTQEQAIENQETLNIQQQIKDQNKFIASDKNITLYRVIQDNKKTLERRFKPLLEMFRTECAYIKELQNECLQAVNEKKELENSYKGKIKITKKEVQEFEQDYKVIDNEELIELQQAVDILLKQACDLMRDLDLIQLTEDNKVEISNNVFVIDEEEEDPDEQLFK